MKRIEAANKALQTFADAEIYENTKPNKHLRVTWRTEDPITGEAEEHDCRWLTKKQSDFLPGFHKDWPVIESQMALTMLVRWIQLKPVLPLSIWEGWQRSVPTLEKAIQILRENGYPETAHCYRCNRKLDDNFEWRSEGHGPSHRSGPTCCALSPAGCTYAENTPEERELIPSIGSPTKTTRAEYGSLKEDE